jgi:hypothetical protein
VDAGAPLVLFVHGVQADEVLLRVAGHLRAHALTTLSSRTTSQKTVRPYRCD